MKTETTDKLDLLIENHILNPDQLKAVIDHPELVTDVAT